MKKLCVLFPGIGYHCDKPLLYYSGKLARARGYDVIALKYSGFPDGAKGNDEKMRLAASHALSQSEQQLEGVKFEDYGRIIFIGKSIGTAACLEYRQLHNISAGGILFTPLVFTFGHDTKGFTAFHGTADPWAATADIERLCSEHSVPLHIYPGTNHSLESNDPLSDLRSLCDIMEKAGKTIV